MGSFELETILPKNIQELINAEVMTVADALTLNPSEHEALKQDIIYQQVLAGELDLRLLLYPYAQILVNRGEMFLPEALALTRYQRNNLNSKRIQHLIEAKAITIADALVLDSGLRETLKQDKIYQPVLAGELNVWLIEYPYAQILVNRGQMTLQEARGLNRSQRKDLKSKKIQQLIEAKVITVADALNSGLRNILNQDDIYQQVLAGELSLRLVACPYAQTLVNRGQMTLQEARRLNHSQRKNLKSKKIQQLIEAGVITLAEALELSGKKRRVLDKNIPILLKCLDASAITLKLGLSLNNTQRKKLERLYIAPLIKAKAITLEKGLNLSEEEAKDLSEACRVTELFYKDPCYYTENLPLEMLYNIAKHLLAKSKDFSFEDANNIIDKYTKSLELKNKATPFSERYINPQVPGFPFSRK